MQKQYEAIVAQNKSLQSELRLAKQYAESYRQEANNVSSLVQKNANLYFNEKEKCKKYRQVLDKIIDIMPDILAYNSSADYKFEQIGFIIQQAIKELGE